MRFTKKFTESDRSTGSGGNWLSAFKPGETRVRFLEELDKWESFGEHYTADGKSYPCPAQTVAERDDCPGCSSGDEKLSNRSRRAACNLLLVDQQQVRAFKIPFTLADELARRAERKKESITSRDYMIIRTGTGLTTKYEFDVEDAYAVDCESYRDQFKDIGSVLQESYDEIWGDVLPPEEEDVPPTKPSVKPAKATAVTTEKHVELAEATLRGMTRNELIEVFAEGDLKLPDNYDDLGKSELIDHLLAVSI
jgi:hypothetical protein